MVLSDLIHKTTEDQSKILSLPLQKYLRSYGKFPKLLLVGTKENNVVGSFKKCIFKQREVF